MGEQLDKILGKLPPQALDLEEAVLGAIMLEERAMHAISDILKVEYFYKEAHKLIYEACLEMFDNGDPIDILTVTQKLRQSGKLELVGGAFYITKLTSKVNSSANIEYHSRIIQAHGIKRNLINVATDIEKKAYEEQTNVFELIDEMEQQVMKITDIDSSQNATTIRRSTVDAMTEIHARTLSDDTVTGVPSGFNAIDRITAGWQKSDLIIIGARPGMGKTALGLAFARNAAVEHNTATAFFSLEMSDIQLTTRLISAESDVESDKLKKGTLTQKDYDRMQSKIGKLVDSKIFIDDTPGLSIRQFKSKARRLKQQHNIGLIFVDYIQLMSGSKRQGQNREGEVSEISRGLKLIAKELGIPVIAFS